MRKFVLVFLCIIVAAVMAQDMIVKRDGTVIPAKVERVSDSETMGLVSGRWG